MRKYLDRKALCLAGAALVLALSLTVGKTMAYFTTYATASGGAEVSLGLTKSTPQEEVVDWTKHITIDNVGERDCFVRVKVFAGAKYQESLEVSWDGDSWEQKDDGYYYYKAVVPAGESTPAEDELSVKVDNMESTENFNVIVVQECTPVLYNSKGKPYADWDVILDSVQDTYE